MITIIMHLYYIIFNNFQTSACDKKKQKEEVPRNQKEQRCQEQTGI